MSAESKTALYEEDFLNRSESDGEEEEEDTCGFVCFVVGLVCMFIVVGAIATLIVLGVDDRRSVSSLTSTHSSKSLSPEVMDSLNTPASMSLIDHTHKAPGRKSDLLILVRSLFKDSSLRDVVRKTWMEGVSSSVEILFVVPARGMASNDLESLKQESITYQDVVVFLDSPTVPESEALLLELVWSSLNRNFSYLMKTRDSMYVRVDVLMRDVVQKLQDTKSNAYLGYFQGKETPRNKKSTKHTEQEWFLCDYFVRFAHSGGYILSEELVHRLSSVATVLFPYNNEDVALGTWLSPYNDVNWTHSIYFDTELGKSRGCRNDLIVFPSTHRVGQYERIKADQANN